ncbi:MAG: FAD-binding oxidoreductase [Desulfobacterales bacterium]|nr:FAD-binding oxidoreductase [Desulfobacterales bacterium]
MRRAPAFRPDWSEEPPPAGSFRAIFKYGHPSGFKHPSDAWYAMLKADFGLTDEDFRARRNEGREAVVLTRPPVLDARQVADLTAIVGPHNVARDEFTRARYAHGKTTEEMMELSCGVVREIADLVIHPRHKEDVRRIVAFCHAEKIPVYVFAGGSSVTLGLRPVRGGITLVMGTHMNRFLELNEDNQTARVQPGILGPAYEEALNQAPERFRARRRYTGGHFPQSFEYSTVGGWVVTLGSGQASTYYGDAGDLVVSQEYVTPAGDFKTLEFPATATGPKINDLMKGSEGCFGVLVEVTMRVYRHMPANRRHFSFMFPTWLAAVEASREIAQGEFGRPAVYRISDPEETDRGLKLYGMPNLVDRFLRKRGFEPWQRCLCLGSVEGDRDYTRLVKRKIRRIARRYGAVYLGGYGSRKWARTRFREPYMREDLNDFGITIDTLETAVTWDRLMDLHRGVRNYIKNRPQTICMAHASHFYPQGTNLYFIFVGRFANVDDYRVFQAGIIDRIQRRGGSLSHHHGVGRLMAPWMEAHLGSFQMAVLRAVKNHFDPHHIMNPGGQLGLDLDPQQRRTP